MEFQEHEDILGQPTLPIVPKDATVTSYFTVTKTICGLVTLIGLYVVGLRIRREVLIWREKAYKLENRRRHGIPDTDRRPFNVAYAAARRDREESANGGKPKRALSRPAQQPQQQPVIQGTREPQGLTNRSNRLASVAVPGAFVSSYMATPAPPPRIPSPSRSSFTEQSNHKRTHSGSTRSYSRHEASSSELIPGDLTSDGNPSRDAQWDQDSSPHKMSDIDEDMEWVPHINNKRSSAKRPLDRDAGDAGSEEDEGVREKRQRKVSLDHSVTMLDVTNAGMEVDEDESDESDDEVPDIVWPTVGSKRQRADAASTFGDDSENEDDTKSMKRHRKKRQTGSRRQSMIFGAIDSGKKRGREGDELTPSEAGTLPRRTKRNRKALPDDMELWSVSSSGRRPRKREIGEEWESNGIRYKIGPNGQRLRQALIKRARSKFTMPKDSNHPDRNANLEVYVETWLSEQEYKEARENRLLAWQETTKYSSNEPENLRLDIARTPARAGKNLLWQTHNNTPLGSPIVPGSPLDSPSDITSIRPKGVRTPGRYSLAVAARANPFEKPATSVRRIVSTSLTNSLSPSPAPPSLADKTNNSKDSINGSAGGEGSYVRPRNLSKWEKQEVEAQAIARLRALKQAESDAAEKEKREKERIEKERIEKAERERKEKEAALAPPPKIPTITVTQPSTDTAKPAASTGGFSFAPPAAKKDEVATTAATTPAPPANLFGPPKTASAPAPTPAPQPEAPKSNNPLFNFPKPAAPVSGSATPAATSTPAASAPPTGGFSFGPPAASSTPAVAPTPTAPSNLFGPPSGEKKEGASASNPLFARLGQPLAPSSGASTPAAAPAASTGFSFAPSAPASASSAATTATAPGLSSGFSFGPVKSTGPTAAATPSSLAGALGGSGAGANPAAPAPVASATSTGGSNLFSFKPSTATTPTAAPAAGSTAPAKSAFTFGPAPATSTPAASTFSAPGPKPAFGPPTTGPSPFGSAGTATTGATPSSSSPFSFPAPAAAQDKGKEAAKPTGFAGFGPPSGGASAFAAPSGASTPSVFGTNGTANASNSKPDAGKFSFSGLDSKPKSNSFTFGAASTPTTTGTATASPFPFGKAATPSTTNGGSAFGGASATNGTSVFGSTSQPKSVFGSTSTPAGTTTGSGLFSGAGAKPLSAFGFGAPPAGGTGTPGSTPAAGTPGAFSFGSK